MTVGILQRVGLKGNIPRSIRPILRKSHAREYYNGNVTDIGDGSCNDYTYKPTEGKERERVTNSMEMFGYKGITLAMTYDYIYNCNIQLSAGARRAQGTKTIDRGFSILLACCIKAAK